MMMCQRWVRGGSKRKLKLSLWTRAPRGWPAGLRALAIGASIGLTGCQSGVLDPKGPIGSAQRTILFNSLAIMLAIVVPTIIATLVFAWWFRAGNQRARYRPNWVYSGAIELVVWSIPTLTIIFLGGIIWIGSHELDPGRSPNPDADHLDIQVVSLDWKWLFIYPKESVAAVNELVVPAGKPLRFKLTSSSVMNTFFVPQLGSMIYTMNGMATTLHLQADAPGQFHSLSGMFSGDGFPAMEFQTRAIPAAEFDGWVAAARAAGGTLDRARYMELARQSIGHPIVTFGTVQPKLFDAVVTQAIPPGPGPQIGRPDPTTGEPQPGVMPHHGHGG